MEKEERLAKLLRLSFDERYKLAATGTDADRDLLISDPNFEVRKCVAIYGSNKHHDILVNDEDYAVREIVAEYGTDLHRDQLVNDADSAVRAAVIKFGNDRHRDELILDWEPDVRAALAQYGNKYHLAALLNDESLEIQNTVKARFMELGLIDSNDRILDMQLNEITDISTGKTMPVTIPSGVSLTFSITAELRKLLSGENASLCYGCDKKVSCTLSMCPGGYKIKAGNVSSRERSSGMEL